jgi:plasmid stabilization system protein ParE
MTLLTYTPLLRGPTLKTPCNGWKNLETVQEVPPIRRYGRVVPELGQADIREVFVDHYRIVYHVEADGISILTVFEGHQLFKL